MAAHIPFVNNPTTSQLAADFYADSEFIRVPLESMDRLHTMLPRGPKLWIDAGVDGFHREFGPITSEDEKREEQRRKKENKKGKKAGWEWRKHMRPFPNYERLADRTFQLKPQRSQVEEFVTAILDKCMEHSPALLTVPQLPLVSDVSRNKINKELAAATGKWKAGANYKGKLILPAVFTNQEQLNLKGSRTKKKDVLLKRYQEAGADGLWSVDSTLSDQKGSPTFRNDRFPGLIKFHEEIGDKLPAEAMTIAGPYWGMNLVLWARGLCDYPAIGLGGAYQYHISGGAIQSPSVRLAIPPLLRWALTGAGFRKWLVQALADIDPSNGAYADFDELRKDYSTLSLRPAARRQIAGFYKQWCDKLESAPPPQRALALYEMLSAAYVLGKTLPDLPAEEKTARYPERIAEYLMLNCF